MKRVFIVTNRNWKPSGYDLTILEVKVIFYEAMLSNDLYKKDRKGNLTKHQEIHMQMGCPSVSWVHETEEVWSQMWSQEEFQKMS